jgi:peptide/nickel transport system ATP-binding protein
MYCGQIVETAPTDRLVADPQHPYTRSLFDAVPRLGDRPPVSSASEAIDGDPADPADPPSGCRFHPRCPVGPGPKPERSICSSEDPMTVAANRRHRAACFFAEPDIAHSGGDGVFLTSPVVPDLQYSAKSLRGGADSNRAQ